MTPEEIEAARNTLVIKINSAIREAVDAALQGAIRICAAMDCTRCVPSLEAHREACLQGLDEVAKE